MKRALQATGIGVELGGTRVLHGIDVDFSAARWTSVVGPNGAGKSTLLKALAGLLPHSGRVQLMDRPLAQWRGRERARCLAWLGQGEQGADDLSVWDVAMLGRLPHQPWLAPPSHADRVAVEQALRTAQGLEWREPHGAARTPDGSNRERLGGTAGLLPRPCHPSGAGKIFDHRIAIHSLSEQ